MTDHPAPLRSTFERVVCISLARREDRWRAFVERLERADWPFGDVERFEAVDGERARAPAWFRAGDGAWGCMQSHLHVLAQALTDGVESLLVLEDDACFPPLFASAAERFIAELPEDWDGLLLGGHHQAVPTRVGERVVRVANGNRAHAVAYRGRYLNAAYRQLTDYPAHIRTPQHHVDHRLGALHFTGRHNVYAPLPWLVGQGAATSDITGRAEQERFWNEQYRTRTPHDAPSRPPPQLPLVAVAGLYFSGAHVVAGALEELGGYLGETRRPSLEDVDLAELCRNFFAEPNLAEMTTPDQRVDLLARWLEDRRRSAPPSARFVVANHPLLALLGSDLRRAVPGKLQIVCVERQVSDAIRSLRNAKWPWFSGMHRAAQLRLQEGLEETVAMYAPLRVTCEQLRNAPQKVAERLKAFLEI